MSLAGKAPSDLTIRILLEAAPFREALGRAIKAVADLAVDFAPEIDLFARHARRQQRHHIRVVTRRKQRVRW